MKEKKTGGPIKNSDLEIYREKVWLGVNDIMRITCVGNEKAKKIMDDVNDLRKKNKLYVPDNKKVLAKDLFEYIGL